MHALLTKLFKESLGNGIGAAIAGDIFAQNENTLVALHLFTDSFTQRIAIGNGTHSYLFPLVTERECSGIIDHDIGIEFFRCGIKALIGKLGCILGYLGGPGIILVKLGLGCQVKIEQFLFKNADGVASGAPLLLFFASAVIGRVGHGVATETIGLDLQY